MSGMSTDLRCEGAGRLFCVDGSYFLAKQVDRLNKSVLVYLFVSSVIAAWENFEFRQQRKMVENVKMGIVQTAEKSFSFNR